MNAKIISIIVIVVAVLVGGYYFLSNRQAQAPSDNINLNGTQQSTNSDQNVSDSNSIPLTNTQSSTNPPANTQFSNEDTMSGVSHEIDFTGTAFTPSTLTIKSGDTVVFKNKSNAPFWPASNPHPVHTDYSGFDAKGAIAAGGSYPFTFTKVGTWGYHDHLHPSIGGTITVTQ